jgi:hypothetical protein
MKVGALVAGMLLAFLAGRWSAVPGTAAPAAAASPAAARSAGAPVVVDRGNAAHAAGGDWLADWNEVRRLSASSVRDGRLGELLQEIVAVDATEATRLALAEPNLTTRTVLLRAVLCAWAKVAPDAAMEWFLARNEREREATSEALMAGMLGSGRPASSLVALLCAADPTGVDRYGARALAQLGEAGRFEEALQLALAAPTGHGEGWLRDVFVSWASRQPDAAIGAATALQDETQRNTALQSIAGGWVASAPSAAAARCAELPDGPFRRQLLIELAQQWPQTEPAAAVTWLASLAPPQNFDEGARVVATSPLFASACPSQALRWAESIADADTRENAIAEVLRHWRVTDPVAAQSVARTVAGVSPARRQWLIDSLSDRP